MSKKRKKRKPAAAKAGRQKQDEIPFAAEGAAEAPEAGPTAAPAQAARAYADAARPGAIPRR